MNMKIKGLRRLASILLCCVLLLGMLPAMALAVDEDYTEPSTTETTEQDSPSDLPGQDGDLEDTSNADVVDGNDDETVSGDADDVDDEDVSGDADDADDETAAEEPGFGLPVIQLPEAEEDEGDENEIMTIAAIDGTTGDTEFHRMTDAAELQAGSHYIIIYGTETDGSYPALCPDSASNNYVGIEMSGDMRTSGNGLKVSLTESCVLTLSVSSSNAWNFTASNVTGTGNRLKLDSSHLFDTSYGSITVTDLQNGAWTLKNSRALIWNGSGFTQASGGNASGTSVEIWTDYVEPEADTTKYYQLTSLDQLADLASGTPFVVVLVDADGNRHAIGSGSPWLLDVTRESDSDGRYIAVDDANINAYVFKSHGECTYGTSGGASYYDFEYIQLTNGNQLYPGADADITSAPFRTGRSDRNNKVRFSAGTGSSDQFYLRGNGDNRWLLYSSNSSTGYATGKIDNDEGYDRVKVEVYATALSGSNKVQFMNVDGTVHTTAYVESSVTLVRDMPDVTVDGVLYTFAGWTMNAEYAKGGSKGPYLSLSDSTNLYDYSLAAGINRFTAKAEGFGLVGNGNPEVPEQYSVSGDTIFYPVYAVRGYDTAVAAKDEDGNSIVGISDYKDQQVGGTSSAITVEKWLGFIAVTVYVDGEKWVDSEPMYFKYHNDNTADLNIKFIWDNILESEYGNDLFAYTSDTSRFETTDQSERYVIDAVVAEQSYGETGLMYELNWMTEHGGQLDNVHGGFVDIYVTTKYNVEYYLDDELITEEPWVNGNPYTTPGTKNAFVLADAAADHHVTEESPLMDPTVNDGGLYVAEYDPETGKLTTPSEQHGVLETFAYDINDYYHTIPIAGSPEELVAEGYELTADAWTLKNEDGSRSTTVAWDFDYELTGTTYRSEGSNTVYADEREGAPYIFRLYAYSQIPAAPTPTPTPTAPATGDDANPLVWTALLVLTAGALTWTVFGYKKRKDQA